MTEPPSSEPLKDVPDAPQHTAKPDRAANDERAAILSGDYVEAGKRRDHRRQHWIKDAIFGALSALVWVGGGLLAALLVIWAIHILAPSDWRWLSKDEVEHVQALLFSGALSAALTLLGKKIL